MAHTFQMCQKHASCTWRKFWKMCRKYSCNNLNIPAKFKCARRNGTHGRIFLEEVVLRRAGVLPTHAGSIVLAHLQMCRKLLYVYEVVPSFEIYASTWKSLYENMTITCRSWLYTLHQPVCQYILVMTYSVYSAYLLDIQYMCYKQTVTTYCKAIELHVLPSLLFRAWQALCR